MVITIKVESTIIVIKLPLKQQKNRSHIFANVCFNRVIFINFMKISKFDLSKRIMSLVKLKKFITIMVLLQ